jgi:hypothetical protein
MFVEQMHKLGINSDVLQFLGFASIFASIATWRTAKKSGDAAHAERFGIFIGLWAPTFFALASDVAVHEAGKGELPAG